MAFALSAFVYEQSQLRKNKTADTPASELVRMHSPVFGAASAKVTIVEFFDPSCETCRAFRSEEHTSELQSLMRISYAVFCLKKKIHYKTLNHIPHTLYTKEHTSKRYTEIT